MALQEYSKALKAAQKEVKTAMADGDYPYLPALDSIINRDNIISEVPLGIVEIPLEQIVGTKTEGRQNSFARNFLPLMEERSEFASKWANVYNYQTETGVSDPIVAYEYLNRFYVLEGNKRVSVMKYLNAYSIEGNVIRLVPKEDDTQENRIYYEFLDFYKVTSINYILFSKEGSYQQLIKYLGKRADEVWTQEEKEDFSSLYVLFRKLYEEKGGKELKVTVSDAFLFYLSLYPYEEMKEKTKTEILKELDVIWKELTSLHNTPVGALVYEPSQSKETIISKLLNFGTSKHLNVAFLYERSRETSSWTYSHELGRYYLDNTFKDTIYTTRYVKEELNLDYQEIIELAIKDGNEIIFAAHQKYLPASLKVALDHPQIKILNCCVNRPFQAVRTYFGRMYEAKFLCGLIAGAMAENDKIAYLADFPIYGCIADINAFALGAKMVNPRAVVYLFWASDKKKEEVEREIAREGIKIVSDMDMLRPHEEDRLHGVYRYVNDRPQVLALPLWNWGKFYEKIIKDIQAGNWNKTSDSKDRKAINYWWGISGEIIDLIMAKSIPSGIKKLVLFLKEQIRQEEFYPFSGELIAQDGTIYGTESDNLSPEKTITMDWFVDNIVGSFPSMEELSEEARELIIQQNSAVPDGGVV